MVFYIPNELVSGLTPAEATRKLVEIGPNQLVKPHKISFLKIALEEMTEPIILLLLAVGIIYSLWGNPEDAITIFTIIVILDLVEIWNEYRAKKAIAALSQQAAPGAKVVRGGMVVEIPTEEVVPGDLLVLVPGTRVAADARVLMAFSLHVDESTLTGEAMPVEKESGSEILAGTLVTTGEGKAEVFATGERTQFGRISAIAASIKEPKTPLQRDMKVLAKRLVWVALAFSITIPLVGALIGRDLREMLLTGLALAFATIPEEAPIIITIILGIGAYQMSKRKFLVKKLRAAEALGDATVILTDKTGTITENKMHVASIFPPGNEAKVLQVARASLTEMSVTPTDRAILEKAEEMGIPPSTGSIIAERSFEANRKTKAILRVEGKKGLLAVTGAPEEVLAETSGDTSQYLEVLAQETAKGRRVIAFAQVVLSTKAEYLDIGKMEHDLEFVGIISIEDPPRPGVRETIDLARQAGIRTVMVTGDHPQTAAFIARSVGIPAGSTLTGVEIDSLSDEDLREIIRNVSIFARTTPEHKYRLMKAFQDNGEVVAVTGDGVNDTLALKGANIAIAMGIKGTDAAKEAADVVLADDNFVTIGHAILEGRKFYDNLKKGFKYYLSAKVALISVFIVPLLFNLSFPFAPIQIIVLELFMDLAASSAFVAEPAEKTIYQRPPRNPAKTMLDAHEVRGIFKSGFSLFAAVMISYLIPLLQQRSLVEAQTYAFTAWIFGHVFLAFISRSEKLPVAELGFFTNKVMVAWGVIAVIFLLIVTGVPVLSVQLKLATMTASDLALVLIISFAAIIWQEAAKFAKLRHRQGLGKTTQTS